MVVLELVNMLQVGNNQYLQPDYLSTTVSLHDSVDITAISNFFSTLHPQLDSKKSPLALLAQTCSQIGADPSNVKPTVQQQQQSSPPSMSADCSSAANIKKKSDTQVRSPSVQVKNIDVKENKIAFKPYDVLCGNNSGKEERSFSELNGNNNNINNNNNNNNNSGNQDFDIQVDENLKRRTLSSHSASDSVSNNNDCNLVNKNYENDGNSKSAFSNERLKSESPGNRDATIVQSGFETVNGQKNDEPPLNKYAADAFGLASLPAFYSPADLDYANPAFRPPFVGSHASMMAAASQQSQYMNYTRAKMAADFPVCKDPYCTGCQFSAHNQKLLMGTPCGSGCTQCEYQRYGLAVAMNPYMQINRTPYVCNWELCCKRFATSEEVLSHLRSHASTIQDPAVASTLLAAHQASVLNQNVGVMFPSARAYPTTTSNPLALASRYHPYATKAGYGPPYQLSPYYAYGGLFGQRIGAAAHP
jgi:hypothetical protein